MAITTKQFQKFTDLNLVWDFLVDIYEYKKDNGVAAPFFEHAIKASWANVPGFGISSVSTPKPCLRTPLKVKNALSEL